MRIRNVAVPVAGALAILSGTVAAGITRPPGEYHERSTIEPQLIAAQVDAPVTAPEVETAEHVVALAWWQALAWIGEVDALREAEAAAATRGSSPAVTAAPAAANYATGGSVWDQLAQCEAGGNWGISTGNGFQGGLQFAPGTWAANKPEGAPANASDATREQQIAAGESTLASSGWGAWPACSSKLGLR